jgi:2-polyprenyl-3-methyl-5-hydroxy-6-metoxy-1,4-benzoquinol methylase
MIKTPSWHESMYTSDFADRTINSIHFLERAEMEVEGLVRLLGISPSELILDVPCGSGRHAKALARRGFNVTGVDINKMLLDRARANSHGLASVKFHKGSMLELQQFFNGFDVVMNMFSSFGYFPSDEENFFVLKQLVQSLRPGGRLVIHNIDRDWLMRVYTPVTWQETDEEFCVEARKYDSGTKYNEVNEIRMNKKTGQAERTYHRMRLYNSDEMVQLFADAGLDNIQCFGGFDGGPLIKGESTHPVYVGRRQ